MAHLATAIVSQRYQEARKIDVASRCPAMHRQLQFDPETGIGFGQQP